MNLQLLSESDYFRSNQPDYILNNPSAGSPTTMLVCERHPTISVTDLAAGYPL